MLVKNPYLELNHSLTLSDLEKITSKTVLKLANDQLDSKIKKKLKADFINLFQHFLLSKLG